MTQYGVSGDIAHRAIEHATQIMTQTERQYDLLKERFNRIAQVVPNPIDLNTKVEVGESDPDAPWILWVGKSDRVKQPEIACRIARLFPRERFLLVMNRVDEALHERVMAEKTSNVRVIERVPIDQIERLFAQARLFLSTSAFEGFPNTFLQAGKYGVPVASLSVDPDRMLEMENCGINAHGDETRLGSAIEELLGNQGEYNRMSAAIRRYVEQRHDLDRQIALFRDLLLQPRHS